MRVIHISLQVNANKTSENVRHYYLEYLIQLIFNADSFLQKQGVKIAAIKEFLW